MALSTKDVKPGNGVAKIITPGTHVVKINSVLIEKCHPTILAQSPDAVDVIINVETKPLEDFVGFQIDKDDASKGNYAGQIGRVKASEWPFKDGVTKTGHKVSREKNLLQFMMNLCINLNVLDWWNNQDGKHDTIEDLYEAFKIEKPFADKWYNATIAGTESVNNAGYPTYYLNVPQKIGNKRFFEPVEVPANQSNLVTYNPTLHLKQKQNKEQASFSAEPAASKADEFEI